MKLGDEPSIKTPIFPILRKVYRTREGFICGICRSCYSSRLIANNCLNVCWYELQAFYPVLTRKNPVGGVRFRCQHCARDYDHEQEALHCANLCSKNRVKRHIQEQLLNGLPLETTRYVPFKLIHTETIHFQSPNVTQRFRTKKLGNS